MRISVRLTLFLFISLSTSLSWSANTNNEKQSKDEKKPITKPKLQKPIEEKVIKGRLQKPFQVIPIKGEPSKVWIFQEGEEGIRITEARIDCELKVIHKGNLEHQRVAFEFDTEKDCQDLTAKIQKPSKQKRIYQFSKNQGKDGEDIVGEIKMTTTTNNEAVKMIRKIMADTSKKLNLYNPIAEMSPQEAIIPGVLPILNLQFNEAAKLNGIFDGSASLTQAIEKSRRQYLKSE